ESVKKEKQGCGSITTGGCCRRLLDTNRKRLRAGLIRIDFFAAPPALEPALQQAHQAGVPVANHEQNQKWRGEVVVIRKGVCNREREVAADDQFDPWRELQSLAVLCGLG